MKESLLQIVDHLILTEHGRDDIIDSSDLKISGDTISFKLNKSEPFEDLEIGDDFVIDSVFVRYELEYRVVVLEIENGQARFALYKDVLNIELYDLDVNPASVTNYERYGFYSERETMRHIEKIITSIELNTDSEIEIVFKK